jgi:sugar phosphate isomerase/epimerase
MKRRHFLAASTATTASALLGDPSSLHAAEGQKQSAFPISACDWSINCRHKLDAFTFAKSLGLQGVEVSFGEPGVENDLREEKVRAAYLAESEKNGVAISSLAMGILNQIPFATDPQTEQWVSDCIEVMPKVRVTNVLLAFFAKGDIKDAPELQDKVIARLKRLAPKAQEAGVVLGIESWLDADAHIRILDAVDSPAVKVYYDVANMTTAGYDIYAEIPKLGHERICQFHMKENGFLLGEGKVDFPRLAKTIAQINYDQWIVIESAHPKGSDLGDAYRHNQRYLRSIFPG